MGVETVPSLRYLGGIIGTLLEGVITLDCMQENCVKEGLKRYNSMESFQRYEIYPAISASRGVLKDASNSPERIFRQGIMIKTTDTGEWFYIGGISPYWGHEQLIVYQGGSEASSQGKLNKSVIDDFVDKGGLGVVPLYKEKVPSVWYNPVLFKDCQGSFGIFWNYLGEFQGGVLSIFSNAPNILRYAEDLIKARKASLTYSSYGHYYLSRAAENDVMRPASDRYPYIYFALGTNPLVAKTHGLQIYPGFTFDTVTSDVSSCCCKIMPEPYCKSSFLDYIKFNEIDIGAPVYATLPCGTSCSTFGLAGLIMGISSMSVNNVQLIYLTIAQPPSDLTTSAIIEWAREMNIYDSLSKLFEAGKRFKKAIADLSTAFPQFIATAAALTVDWLESYDDGLKQAEDKAKELNELYNKVVEELAGKPPSITNRYVYDQWWKFKTRVEKCAKEIIVEYPDITYDELVKEVENCAEFE
ncbi:hypothetical protein D1867_02040 [Acidianus infernus]|uniref:Uncharacterized protein n=1 Tax=Acidianus infernus TaxID=12915 RepID=A0A6A9QAW8_ACIIN|nr:hypothetical protein [Acidianus infernus]MUM64049.1 hypothetical protein [Acidianus infernus]